MNWWIDGWMEKYGCIGLINELMNSRIDGWANELMDEGLINGWMNGQSWMIRRMSWWIDGLIHKRNGDLLDGWRIDWLMDELKDIDGWMDELMNW